MSTVFANAGSTDRARGRWIPWMFVLGMLTVVGANATLVYFAMQSWGGLVTDRAFERGVTYNRLLAAAAAQDALGWNADVVFEAAANGKGPTLVVALRNAGQEPMSRAVVAAEARRPLATHDPVLIAMRYVGEGRYAGAADSLRPGQWDIRLAVANEGSAAHFTQRIVVR
jgi:nitrogen fixation protein FixH